MTACGRAKSRLQVSGCLFLLLGATDVLAFLVRFCVHSRTVRFCVVVPWLLGEKSPSSPVST
jgi:hypothetical protein